MPEEKMTLPQELQVILNKYSRENSSNTPDFILAAFMIDCLRAGELLIANREQWYGQFMKPGKFEPLVKKMRALDTRIKKKSNNNRLLEFRLKNGWDQLEVAKMLGLDRSTYCRYENGDIGEKYIERALKLAKIYNCKVESLFVVKKAFNYFVGRIYGTTN